MNRISNWQRWLRATLAAGITAGLVACGGSDDPAVLPAPPAPTIGSATLDAAGGVVDGPDGVQLVVPSGALAAPTTFRISRDASGAPALEGINALSPVYAATPHGQTFSATALLSIPLSAAQIPAGATPVLLKAEPGGKWRVMPNGSTDPARMAADVGDLSFFVIGACTDGSASAGWVIGAVNCPSNHELRMTMLDGQNQPVQVLRGPNGVQLPLWYATDTVQTRTFTVSWTRPAGTTRTDTVDILGFPTGFTLSPRPPQSQDASNNFSTTFTVTIDPSRVSGASLPNGVLVRPRAAASYSTTAFRVGVGNVRTGFVFEVDIPILVRFTGTQPVITQQPTPANVSVVENNAFTLAAAATGPNLSYEWRYYQNINDTAVRVAEGTSNLATYTSPPAPLGYNGRLYYVHVCSNRGVAGQERCVATQSAQLTVTQFVQAMAITTQPVNRDIIEGESVNFSATVTGTPTPTLQWHYGVTCRNLPLTGRSCSGTPFSNGAGVGGLTGASIGGAAALTLDLTAVPLTANGTTIALAVTQQGFANVLWSDVATLAVRTRSVAPAITTPLTPQTTSAGGSATFTVGVSGTEPINMTWSIGGVGLAAPGDFAANAGSCRGAVAFFDNNRRIVLSGLTEGCSGLTVLVEARNIAGGPASSSATLTVNAVPTAPTITQQPAVSTINEDTRATLSVGYTGTGPVTLTLQRFTGGVWADVSNTTSSACASPCAILTPVLPLAENGAMFRVRLSNALGSVESTAVTITVNITRAPLLTTQPAAATVDANLTTAAGTATFQFAISDEIDTLVWQWLVNGQPLVDGSGVAGNGVLQQATVSGATGTLTISTPGALTVSNVPLAANGAQLSVRVTRTGGGQSRASTSAAATLTVNTGIPANALTATQVVAGQEWSLVLRPDRTVWAWGNRYSSNGYFESGTGNLTTTWGGGVPPGTDATRPVRIYPSALTDVRAISGWSDGFWAIKGEPGTSGSRVLHWGWARSGADGRGTDGNGNAAGSVPTYRYNNQTPVEVLTGPGQPVDRVCAIAGGADRLLMIRAIDDANLTTDCASGSAKTVWMVGSITSIPGQSTGVAQKLAGLPQSGTGGYSPPAVVFQQLGNSSPDMAAIALEDGRAFGLGNNVYNGYGLSPPSFGRLGPAAAVLLPNTWGTVRSFGTAFYYSLLAIRDDGSVVVSGYDGFGELGLGTAGLGQINGPLPVRAETCASLPCADALIGVSAIASTNSTTTLALKNGQILGWGSRIWGLLGSNQAGNQLFPRAVTSAVSGFTALSASDKHALVIGPGNVVYAWGSNLRFALGDTQDRTAPTLVTVGP